VADLIEKSWLNNANRHWLRAQRSWQIGRPTRQRIQCISVPRTL